MEAYSAGVPVQGSFAIDRSREQGAILFLNDDAERRAVHDNLLMPKYMRRNYQAWMRLVREELGFALDVDKLYFVRGFIKSKAWATMTFDKASSSYSGAVSVGYGPAGISLSATWSDEMQSPPVTRSGPSLRSVPGRQLLSITDGSRTTPQSPYYDAPRNQCIFLSYYKMKVRRFLAPKVIKAAAEPRDPSPPGSSDSEDSHLVTVHVAGDEVVEAEVEQESPSRAVSESAFRDA